MCYNSFGNKSNCKGVFNVTEYRELSKVFSPSFIKKFAQDKHTAELENTLSGFNRLQRYVSEGDYWKFYNEAYNLLSKKYRFEYIYKNEMYMYILKTYNVSNDDGILSEVKSGDNIADLVYLNGTSKAFEIKTEIDNNNRLLDQIISYSKLFKEVTVVTYEENATKLMKVLPHYVGLMAFVKKGQFRVIRDAKEYTRNLDKEEMFRTLRRNEYEDIIRNKFEELPDVNDAEIYEACYSKFNTLNVMEAHDEMIAQLKRRSNKALLKRTRKWPKSISFLIENSKLRKSDKDELSELLN